MKLSITYLLATGLAVSMLAGCGSLEALTGDSFMLEGELPPDFSLKAQAHYGVVNDCNGRSQARSFESGFKDSSHEYRFKVPVNYRDGLCEMRLARVGLFIHGRYGEKDWQRTYDNGGLVLVDALPEGAPGFDASGMLRKTAECTWLFQISKLYLELSKLLSCKGTGAFLAHEALPGKSFRLDIRVRAQEEPSHDRRWIQTEEGWRPCQETEYSERCQDPPKFKKFQMNEQECIVYPNCRE